VARRPEPPPDTEDLLNLPLESGHGSKPDLEAQDLLPFEGSDVDPPRQPQPDTSPAPVEMVAGIGARVSAGILDLAVVAAACGVALVGSWALGAKPMRGAGPGLLLFALCFSYLYEVVPLTFWGRTPGMALAGLVARNTNGEPLVIRQSFYRWLASLLTVVLLGLPSLLALGGRRSLADRMSHSLTVRLDPGRH
jgi:uncharacterized RDD family membrane protein YckC